MKHAAILNHYSRHWFQGNIRNILLNWHDNGISPGVASMVQFWYSVHIWNSFGKIYISAFLYKSKVCKLVCRLPFMVFVSTIRGIDYRLKYRRIYEQSKIFDFKWLAANFFITLPLVVIKNINKRHWLNERYRRNRILLADRRKN